MAQFRIRGQNKRNPLGPDNFYSPKAYPIGVYDIVSVNLDTPLYRKSGYSAWQGWNQQPLAGNNDRTTISSEQDNAHLYDKRLRYNKHDLSGWIRSPLSSNSIAPLTNIFDLPVKGKSQPPQSWFQSPLSANAVIVSQNPVQLYDLPVQLKKLNPKSQIGWMGEDSTGPFPSQWVENPLRRNPKYNFDGYLQQPLSANAVAVASQNPSQWVENPVLKQRQVPKYFTGFFNEVGDSSGVSTIFANPPVRKVSILQDWIQSPLGSIVAVPVAIGQQQFDLPVSKKVSLTKGYLTWSNTDATGAFSQVFDLPLSGKKQPPQFWTQTLDAGIGVISTLPAIVFDVPVKAKRFIADGWISSPLQNNAIELNPANIFDNPPTGKKALTQFWTNTAVGADAVLNTDKIADQVFDNPSRSIFTKGGYSFVALPLSDDAIIIPPLPSHGSGKTKGFNKRPPLQYDQSYLDRLFGTDDSKLKDEVKTASPELFRNAILFEQAVYEIKLALITAITLAQNDSAVLNLAVREKQIIDSIVAQKAVEVRTQSRRREEDFIISIITDLF